MFQNRCLLFLAVCFLISTGCSQTKTTPPTKPKTIQVSRSRTLSILTYNVLYDRDQWAVRKAALMQVINTHQSDIMAFQEVSPWFISTLKAQPWSKNYHFSTHGHQGAPGGLLVLSTMPIQKTSVLNIPSVQGRRALLVKLKWSDTQSISLVNVHLDSYLKDGPSRARQIQAVEEAVRDAPMAVFLGDMNFGDGEQPETRTLASSWQDPWLVLHPKENGWTWDRQRNPMADKGSFKGEGNRRLDRILYRASWRPTSIMRLGDAAVESNPNVFPSDHFGVVAQFDVVQKTKQAK